MAEFCKCGSLMIHGNCTNKKCTEHKKSLVDEATFEQLEYIKNLYRKLSEDASTVNLEFLSKKEASNLIDKLLERLENEQ